MNEILIFYLMIISILSIIVTIYDKFASRRLIRHRISEKGLLGLGILGGAFAMYACMQIIRHKTKKNKFMVGLPLIMIGHLIIYFIFINFRPA